jgi:hypothetical protein
MENSLSKRGSRGNAIEGPEQRRLAGMSNLWTLEVYQPNRGLDKKKSAILSQLGGRKHIC